MINKQAMQRWQLSLGSSYIPLLPQDIFVATPVFLLVLKLLNLFLLKDFCTCYFLCLKCSYPISSWRSCPHLLNAIIQSVLCLSTQKIKYLITYLLSPVLLYFFLMYNQCLKCITFIVEWMNESWKFRQECKALEQRRLIH